MELIILQAPISVCCITASSFPDGVLKAHQDLHQQLNHKDQRRFFGISNGGPNGSIIYKAAAEVLSAEEATHLQLESFSIRAGKYAGTTLHRYMENPEKIGQTFTQLLQHPELDPAGYCLEIYLDNDEVQCLVKLVD